MYQFYLFLRCFFNYQTFIFLLTHGLAKLYVLQVYLVFLHMDICILEPIVKKLSSVGSYFFTSYITRYLFIYFLVFWIIEGFSLYKCKCRFSFTYFDQLILKIYLYAVNFQLYHGLTLKFRLLQ